MPQKEGIELIMELRKSGNPDLKIIAISGGGRIQSNEYLSMALKLGADTALTKPIVNEELIEKVEQFIGPS
jgi:CheY-like chemotaxis protein